MRLAPGRRSRISCSSDVQDGSRCPVRALQATDVALLPWGVFRAGQRIPFRFPGVPRASWKPRMLATVSGLRSSKSDTGVQAA